MLLTLDTCYLLLDTKVMKQKELEDIILAKPGTRLDYPFNETAATYKVHEKMFALIAEGTEPLNISLKCDPQLSEVLREKYESVLPGYHLNKKHWITVVLSGQLGDDEVYDLINHSYDLVVKSLPKNVQEKLTN